MSTWTSLCGTWFCSLTTVCSAWSPWGKIHSGTPTRTPSWSPGTGSADREPSLRACSCWQYWSFCNSHVAFPDLKSVVRPLVALTYIWNEWLHRWKGCRWLTPWRWPRGRFWNKDPRCFHIWKKSRKAHCHHFLLIPFEPPLNPQALSWSIRVVLRLCVFTQPRRWAWHMHRVTRTARTL